MTRMRIVVALFVLAVAGCSKPSVEDCRKAIVNMQRIRGLEDSAHAPDPESHVRRCRSTGNPDAVKCIIAAKTPEELERCEKME